MATAATQLPADKFDSTMTFVRPENPPQRAPLDKLAVLPGFNTRLKDAEYAARVAALQDSMSKQGFYEDKPFSVVMLPNDDTIYIFDGEHRFDAARAASLDGADFSAGLPIAWAKDGATVRDLTIHLVHGNAGANLNQVELAAVVRRLKALGMNKDEIASEIGRTPRHVDNLLVLAGANATVRKAVASGQIAAAEAVKLIRQDPKTAGDKIGAAVKAAEERGKAKATPKTMREAAPTPMRTLRFEHVVEAGTVMGDLLKAVAKQVRGETKFGDDDKLTEGFTLNIALAVVDHDAIKAREERAAAAETARKERERVAAEKKAERETAAKAKADAKKAADKAKADAKKAADKAKADAAKAAEKAKADKAKAAAKVAGAKTAAATKQPTAAEAKANARAHLGTDKAPDTPASKAAAGVKAAGATEKPAKADSKPSATQVAGEAALAAAGADSGAGGGITGGGVAPVGGNKGAASGDDPNKGL
jgi:ParB-like chromosome segregation protein Spo0J